MRRTSILALPLVLALAQGCGGSDSDPAPTGPESPTASVSESTSPSPSPTDVATGIRLTMPNSTVRAPEGWVEGKEFTRNEEGADSPDSLSWISLGEIDAFGSQRSAEELARVRIEANLYPKAPKVLPVTELAGTPAYHIAGFVSDQQYIEEFGTIARDRIVTLTFSFNEKVPASERKRVVAQVLPTFEWR